jgi:hypothetical protein
MSMILRALAILGVCFLIALALMALYFIAGHSPATGDHPVVEYKDFVSILLTAIAVMIGVAAVFAAFAAIWGFDLLRREIVKTATEAAERAAAARVNELVPSQVDKALEFEREVPGAEADKIAEEFGKEKGNG